MTSLTGEKWAARELYEELYCERGNMENRIKEQFSLFADRVSAETIRANQLRLYLSAMAYILVSGLRRVWVGRNARLGSVRRCCPVIAPQAARSICDRDALAKSTAAFFQQVKKRDRKPTSHPLFATQLSSVRNAG